jgi:hypothetical protein
VSPKKIDRRAVGIRLFICVMMVSTMNCHPEYRRTLQRTYAEDRQRVLKPFGATEAAMGQDAVEASVDAEDAENIKPQQSNDDATPAKKPGRKGRQRQQVTNCYGNCPTPHNAGWVTNRGYRWRWNGRRWTCKADSQRIGLISRCFYIADSKKIPQLVDVHRASRPLRAGAPQSSVT